MKKIVLATLTALLFSTNGYSESSCEQSKCQINNAYVKGAAGLNWMRFASVSYNTGYILSGALGYHFTLFNALGSRVELEYAYRKNQRNNFLGNSNMKGDYQASTLMVNALVDFNLPRCIAHLPIKTYVGGGVGCNFQKLSHNHHGSKGYGHNNDFGWQVLLGADYALSCKLDLNLEYKFSKTNDLRIYNNSLALGITYNFN